MNQLYLKKTKDLEEMSSVNLLENNIDNSNGKNRVLVFNEKEYVIEDKLSDDSVILGYAVVSNKENKKLKVKANKIKTTINNEIAILKETEGKKVIGYVRVEKDNTYIGLIEEKQSVLFIILPLFIGLLIGVLVIGLTTPDRNCEKDPEKQTTTSIESGTDEKGTGELDSVKTEFMEQRSFRMRLNTTPTITNGKMNLRLESPQEENRDYGFIVKVYITGKLDSKGNVIETYEEMVHIYTSPMIYANENVMNCTVNKELELGHYVGKAVYEIYDLNNVLLGKVASKLSITVE